MEVAYLERAIEFLEKANADLEPELLPAPLARDLLAAYSRAQKLVAFGVAALSRKLDDAAELARVTGTSMGKAKETLATGRVMGSAPELSDALERGDISLDQATEIARAEESVPGEATELLPAAQSEPLHALRDKARRIKLEAEQHRDLAARQHAARGARSHTDELGMVHLHLAVEPHVGAPIVARAEAEAARLHRHAKKDGTQEPFERHLADAYAALLQGGGGRTRRPELVALVSHEVAKRGWTDVREGRALQDPRSRAGGSRGRQGDRRGRLSHRGLLRRQRSAAHPPLESRHPDRGRRCLRAGPASGVRRRQMHRLR